MGQTTGLKTWRNQSKCFNYGGGSWGDFYDFFGYECPNDRAFVWFQNNCAHREMIGCIERGKMTLRVAELEYLGEAITFFDELKQRERANQTTKLFQEYVADKDNLAMHFKFESTDINEINHWLWQCKGEYWISEWPSDPALNRYGMVFFTNRDDAMRFKLRWVNA